jgi:hypothetical protein
MPELYQLEVRCSLPSGSLLTANYARAVPVKEWTSEQDVAAANAHVERRTEDVRRGRHLLAD